jgi:hypothetical protein
MELQARNAHCMVWSALQSLRAVSQNHAYASINPSVRPLLRPVPSTITTSHPTPNAQLNRVLEPSVIPLPPGSVEAAHGRH